ncbi:hypothetical protein [Atopobacter phocae]|uniref:hypothetical protein n=1 Tax=Atopobacter phocae TaxID=136492 RepID=UPI000470665F|nr:hypothetical protein [Atopobacter phocae]
MRAVLISCFNYYDNRLKLVDRYLSDQGYEVTYITADYDTVRRKKFISDVSQAIQIPVIPYRKNLSFERIWSHIRFAKDVEKKLEEIEPQLIFCMLPPNALGREVIRYKKKHPKVRVIFDIYDMWPESFPIQNLKKWLSIPFYIWRDLRENALKYADGFTYECKLYREMIGDQALTLRPHAPFYLAQQPVPSIPFQHTTDQIIRFLYLGSINNVVDLNLMIQFLETVQSKRAVHLDIIGGGENQDIFIKTLQEKNIPHTFHGMIFDNDSKQAIIKQVHYGLNVFKEQLTVGLTMKSVDYFKFSLPIINTIGGDTKEWLEEFELGYQLERQYINRTVDQVIQTSPEQWQTMSQSAKRLFDTHFSTEVVQNHINHFLSRVIFPAFNNETERGEDDE